MVLNQWWLEGEWRFDEERIVSLSANTTLGIVYKASQANLVMGFSDELVNVELWLDGEKITEEAQGRFVVDGALVITEEELFYLTEHDEVEEHTIELRFAEPGVQLYAWTFG